MLACLRPSLGSSHLTRAISSSSTRFYPRNRAPSRKEEDEDGDEDEDRDAIQYKKRNATRDAGPTAKPWLEGEGERYRDPKEDGPNWLEASVVKPPFRSFRQLRL